MSADRKRLTRPTEVGVFVAVLVAVLVAGMVAFAAHTKRHQHDQRPVHDRDAGMKITTRNWNAWYNRMPGTDGPYLLVSGTCELHGRTAKLEASPDGSIDETGVLTLKLVVDTTASDDDTSSEQRVIWKREAGDDEIKTVRILVPGVEKPISVDVTIAQ